ncbi:methylthioribose-1-phosphate isomerase [Enterococcus sp. PF1-24]|uniref:S-methyl-5-thioribose-1-phosphate isomerase n=1 Tax=unclassified Enterococcus TaxID=2608891 RepID=UPI002474A6F7|nr:MULTISPECIES: S-methyl-5-thioribose-1-phosphate isomerase [unclassified Enterococcus]MDH6363955.1 methylthioribose-1-phosphate isomerase [Enterococcus sp. PFB1-1]MDH6401056.1 methylthioribose-1-phosphate isomerase [Enterococcus sp. PF1-24]
MKKEVPVSISWDQDAVIILDQSKLPTETEYIRVETPELMHECIRTLTIRGAGALSIGGAYGVYLGIQKSKADTISALQQEVEEVADYMATARPTAVKLFVMIDKIRKVSRETQVATVSELKAEILEKCHEIRQENIDACKKIGEYGITLLENGMTVLTHCNAGSYATVERGSALAPFYLAKEKGMDIRVFADETRPLLQGSRLTAHELQEAGVDVTLICDNMAAYCMQQGMIDAVIVSSDRIAANGDLVNKIGTYNVAIAAKHHKIPFYMASTFASVDFSIATGKEIPIEERDSKEITHGFGKQTAPDNVKTYNPAFDVTPNELITAMIFEKGILYPNPNYQEALLKMKEI